MCYSVTPGTFVLKCFQCDWMLVWVLSWGVWSHSAGVLLLYIYIHAELKAAKWHPSSHLEIMRARSCSWSLWGVSVHIQSWGHSLQVDWGVLLRWVIKLLLLTLFVCFGCQRRSAIQQKALESPELGGTEYKDRNFRHSPSMVPVFNMFQSGLQIW